MVYLVEEYYKQYPEREKLIRPVFEKFKNSEKYLHEMSLEELNEIVADWAQKPATIEVRRGALSLYLRWLKEQGVNTNPDIVYEILFNKKPYKCLVYTTDDIHRLWDELFQEIDKVVEKKGKTVGTESLLVCYVSGILGFYGMTKEQIMSLQLNDINNSGVNGYDLSLTKKDKEILLRYKDFDTLTNKQPLIGTGYIRSSKSEHPSEEILTKALGKIKGTEKVQYLKNFLTHSNLYKQGLMNRIFEYEKEHRPAIDNALIIPDWFKQIIYENKGKQTTLRTISQYKQEYIAYKTERNAYAVIIDTKTNDVDNIISELDSVIVSISDIKLQKRLRNIENKIKGLVK